MAPRHVTLMRRVGDPAGRWISWFLALGVCLAAGCHKGEQPGSHMTGGAPPGPPPDFPLSSLVLTVERTLEGFESVDSDRTEIHGTGLVRFRRNTGGVTHAREFHLSHHHITSLVREFLLTDFFLYPESMPTSEVIAFTDDGHVSRRVIYASHTRVTEISFRAEGYQRSVRFSGTGPCGILSFVERLERMLAENGQAPLGT